jgi:hypothetical protein
MNTLERILANWFEADHTCAYITVEREPLEALIAEWTQHGDQLTRLSVLLTQARNQLVPECNPGERRHSSLPDRPRVSLVRELDAAIRESAAAIARHRHSVRSEFASRLKQILRSAIRDVGVRTTDTVVAGRVELANRIESNRKIEGIHRCDRCVVESQAKR